MTSVLSVQLKTELNPRTLLLGLRICPKLCLCTCVREILSHWICPALTGLAPDLLGDRNGTGKEVAKCWRDLGQFRLCQFSNTTPHLEAAPSPLAGWEGFVPFPPCVCVCFCATVCIFLPAFIKAVPWSVYLQSARKMGNVL